MKQTLGAAIAFVCAFVSAWGVGVTLWGGCSVAGELAVFSYALPPGTYETNQTITGPVADVVAELSRAAGLSQRPIPLPVSRLLVEVEHGEGIGFPLARNPTREPHFEWIVELYTDAFAFVTLAPHAPVNSFEAARLLSTITVNNRSAP